MTDTDKKRDFRKELEAHLESPMPILIRLRNFTFGKTHPDFYTQFSFFLALFFWIIFMSWAIMGSVVIRSRYWMEAEKGINVRELIGNRGIELGYEPLSFIGRLETFYALQIGFWLIVFIGMVLMWRKKLRFVYFFFGGAGLYLVGMWFVLGFSYWYNDTTFFDKLTYFILVGHTAVYAYFLQKENKGEKQNFFGIEDEE